jgi:hypothetical protein
MRIIVSLAIDVDPADWAAIYGTDASPTAVRADVRDYMLNQCQQSAGALDTDASVEIKE